MLKPAHTGTALRRAASKQLDVLGLVVWCAERGTCGGWIVRGSRSHISVCVVWCRVLGCNKTSMPYSLHA